MLDPATQVFLAALSAPHHVITLRAVSPAAIPASDPDKDPSSASNPSVAASRHDSSQMPKAKAKAKPHRRTKKAQSRAADPAEVAEGYWKIRGILAERVAKGQLQYLLDWDDDKDGNKFEPTWVCWSVPYRSRRTNLAFTGARRLRQLSLIHI